MSKNNALLLIILSVGHFLFTFILLYLDYVKPGVGPIGNDEIATSTYIYYIASIIGASAFLILGILNYQHVRRKQISDAVRK